MSGPRNPERTAAELESLLGGLLQEHETLLASAGEHLRAARAADLAALRACNEQRNVILQRIADLVAADATRPADADLTLFKAMGVGLSDLALGIEVLARAEKRGGAHALPPRVRMPPRLQ